MSLALIGHHSPKPLLIILMLLLLITPIATADTSLDAAYKLASKDAEATTTLLVDRIDLDEFADYFSLELNEEDEQLIRIALMAYCNGAILEHPRGINKFSYASLEEDPYVGNRKTKKFHFSWCSSVSDMQETNKVTFSTRDEAIEADFVPCKKCNP